MFVFYAGPNKVCNSTVIAAVPQNIDLTKWYTVQQSFEVCRANGMDFFSGSSSNLLNTNCLLPLQNNIQNTFIAPIWNRASSGPPKLGMLCVKKHWSKGNIT